MDLDLCPNPSKLYKYKKKIKFYNKWKILYIVNLIYGFCITCIIIHRGGNIRIDLTKFYVDGSDSPLLFYIELLFIIVIIFKLLLLWEKYKTLATRGYIFYYIINKKYKCIPQFSVIQWILFTIGALIHVILNELLIIIKIIIYYYFLCNLSLTSWLKIDWIFDIIEWIFEQIFQFLGFEKFVILPWDLLGLIGFIIYTIITIIN
jgi:hypothetical protein